MNDRKATTTLDKILAMTQVLPDVRGAPAYAILPWPIYVALTRIAAMTKEDFADSASKDEAARLVAAVFKDDVAFRASNDKFRTVLMNKWKDAVFDKNVDLFPNFAIFDTDNTEDVADAAHAARIRARIDAGEEEVFPAEIVEALDAGESAIRVFRKHRGLTQAALAAEVGIDQSYLSELETGAKTPSAKTLRALARVLGVDMEILLPEEDEFYEG